MVVGTDHSTASKVTNDQIKVVFDNLNASQYSSTNKFLARVSVHSTSTSVSCSLNPITYGGSSTCTATVTDTAASGQTAPTGTVTFDNGSASGNFSSLTCSLGSPTSSSSSCSVTYTPSAVGTGTHTIGANYGSDSTHSSSSGSTALTVDKAAASIVITWATPQTYNSSTHPASAVVNGVGGDTNLSPAATLEYFAGSTAGLAGTGTATAPTNAGTYTVRASFAGNTNYDPASDVKTIVIDKAAASIVITWATPQTYNSSTHPASAVVNGVGGDTNLSPAATFEYFAGSTAGLAGTGTATAPTNAGTYTVRASFAGNSNYDPASDVKTIVIDKAAASIVITWATPQTYNSSTHPASAVVNGVGGDTNLSPAATFEYFCRLDRGPGRHRLGDRADQRRHLHGAGFLCWQQQLRPGSDAKTIVIDKAAASIVITWATPQTYNSSTHPASAIVNGVGGDTNLCPAATLEYFAGSTAAWPAPARRPRRPTPAPTRCGPPLPATATTTRPRT